MSWLRLTATPQTASHIHIRHICCVRAHWYAVHGHTVSVLHSYTHPTWLRFWGSGSLVESKWYHYDMVEADSHTSNCFPHPYYTYTKCLSTLICCPWTYSISLTNLYPPYLAHFLGFWVTCRVKMMSLCHDWGWKSPQTASQIHTSPLKIVWACWYAVHGHTVSALQSYIHPTWFRFWGSGSLVESKLCHYVMVEADSHLKHIPASILVFAKCLDMLMCYP